MEKVVRIGSEYHDKVKALADASGESMGVAMNGVVAAGLGELEGLANALKGKGKAKLDGSIVNEEIFVAEARRDEVKAKPKVKVVEATDTEERRFFCLECKETVKVSESHCSVCGTPLNWNAVEGNPGPEESEEAEGTDGWVWVVGALIGILALRQRIRQNSLLS